MFTNLFCHSASTVRENSAGFFVIANYYSLNKYTYGTNYFKSQIIIDGNNAFVIMADSSYHFH
jgi:hypothetical protein